MNGSMIPHGTPANSFSAFRASTASRVGSISVSAAALIATAQATCNAAELLNPAPTGTSPAMAISIPLSEILSDLPSYRSTPELKLPCTDEAKFEVVAALRERLAADHEIIDLDGVRLETPEGWGLVRASNTSPVLVLRFEATSDEALEKIRGIIMKELEPLLPENS